MATALAGSDDFRSLQSASPAVRWGDRLYLALTLLASLSIFAIILWLAGQLYSASRPSIHHSGLRFVTGPVWDETRDIYQILPFVFGTLYSSFLALLLAVPISLGAAIFLSELAPKFVRTPVTFLIELLAAIPSVVYGLWGIFVLIPILREQVIKPLSHSALSRLPLFHGDNDTGNSMLAAAVVLAIMVIPFITAVTRDILRAIPRIQREGSYALGATQWETISRVVMPYARSGIIGAVILGLGRALGETMAVTMVIGNGIPTTKNGVDWSLFNPANTMASALANKFNEAVPGLNVSALVEVGLVLFVVTIFVNILARLLVRYTAKSTQ